MRTLGCVLALMLLPSLGFAQETELTSKQMETLRAVKAGHRLVDEWASAGLIEPKDVAGLHADLNTKASFVAMRPITSIKDIDDLLADKRPLSEQAAGFFTFLNIVTVIAVVMGVIATCWLCWLHIVKVLKAIPIWAYESIGYGVIAICIYSGIFGLYFSACLLLFPMMYLSKYLHYHMPESLKELAQQVNGKLVIQNIDKLEIGSWEISFSSVVWLAEAVVFAGVAYYYQSYVCAFCAVASLLSYLGFTVIVSPLCYALGYKDDEQIPRTMVASAILLTLAVAARITNFGNCSGVEVAPTSMWQTYAAIFVPSMLFLGTFVYCISCLIVSSKWYSFKYNNEGKLSIGNYPQLQALTIVSGVAALYVGSVYQIGLLQGIAGTFFVLYLIEKYMEIPWHKVGWAWGLLGLSVGLYAAATYAMQHPEYFLLGK